MKSSDKETVRSWMPSEVYECEVGPMGVLNWVEDSVGVYDEDSLQGSYKPVPGYEGSEYVSFGADDMLPFTLARTIGEDEVLSQNLFFNILTSYGSGVKYMDRESRKGTTDPEIRRWMMRNSLNSFYLEQCTDMKYYFFAVAVILVDRAGERIVKVQHKDACYCRFGRADKRGRVKRMYFADWRSGVLKREDVERIWLLDERDPLGELEILMGRAPGRDGLCRQRTEIRKFAVVMRFPTPGQRYYPIPYYTAIFRGDWYDIKRLISKGKKAKIKNHASVKYQVEVHRDFWNNIIEEEGIVDPVKAKERIKKEKDNIRRFVAGVHNSGKVWITGYYIDSYGKEQRMVRVNVIDASKEGGDWSEDIQEASNMLCYGTNIHPNLVGAVPGKASANNSGSDKRELFTLKQALETAFHDMLLKVHELVIYFNRWEEKVYPEVPLVLLTTLDKKTDAEKVSPSSGDVEHLK